MKTKKILPSNDKPPRREPDVQTILPFLDPKKKPQPIRDFEERRR